LYELLPTRFVARIMACATVFVGVLTATAIGQAKGSQTVSPQIVKGDPISAEGTGAVMIQSKGRGCSGTLLTNQWAITAQHCQLDTVAPSNISISMGSQTTVGSFAVGHPSLDFALVKLAEPFKMNGSTSGYKVLIFSSPTSALQAQTVRVWGYGCNASSASNPEDCTGFDGTLRQGLFQVNQAPVDSYSFSLVEPNAKGQSMAPGDSGSGAFVNTAQGWALAGVFKGPDEGRPENWRDWAMAYVNGTPIPLPEVWYVYTSSHPTFLTPPLPNNYNDSYSWNPCPGEGKYLYSPAFDLEDGNDVITLSSDNSTVQVTGQGTTACRGDGPITVAIRTNASNQSTGLTAMPISCNYGGPSSAPPQTSVGPGLSGVGNNIYFFATAPDGRIMYQRAEQGRAGLCWQEVDGNGRSNVSPGAGAIGAYVFTAIRDSSGHVSVNQAPLGKPFGQWFAQDMITDAAPAVVGVGNNIYIFAKSMDGRIMFNRAQQGQSFTGWQEVQGGGRTNSAPAAGAVGDHVFVAIRGLDGHVSVNQADLAMPFGQWFPQAMVTDVAPAVVGVGDNVYLFAKTTDGKVMFNRAPLRQAFVGWQEVQGHGQTNQSPGAGAVGDHVYVSITGLNGRIQTNQADLGQPFGAWF